MEYCRVHSASIEKELSCDLLDELVFLITDGSVIYVWAVLYLCPILYRFHPAWATVELLGGLVFELLEGLLDIVLYGKEDLPLLIVPVEIDSNILLGIPIFLNWVFFSEAYKEMVNICFVNIFDGKVIHY